ncbi:MAG: hypothetical protein PUI76_06545 [Mollicutes bacterium]|nr:hypothetical protein [Mollicutes bacterium]
MTPEFGYYTALICVSTGMMVFCALLSAGSRALPTPQRRIMFVPFCIVMVTAFLEWGGEAIEELPMALAMFDAAVENERKTDPMMPTISYGYATCKPGEKTVWETIEEADSNMYRTKHRYYLDRNIPENR